MANVTTTTYTFNGLAATTAYTLGVQAICSATDSASMVTVEASTSCPDVTTLPYNEGFENGLGCWMTINASADGQPWSVNNCASLSTVDPHGGAYVASSWSWSSSAMHANAWLISPKFVLPNATDSLSFSWWEITNPSYHDSYSVVLSTTTNDTAAFTTVLRPYDTAAGTWTMQTVDLTPYAGQSVYIAFHHVDYNENYLLIDDIALYQGTYSAPDSLTINLSINNPALGSINPLPGVYHVALNDSLVLTATPAAGATFDGWKISVGTQTMGTIPINPFTFPVNQNNITFGELNVVAMFSDSTSAPDSMTVIINTADATMGTTNPAPGTYHYAVGSESFLAAIPNPGYHNLYWIEEFAIAGMVEYDTLYADTVNLTVVPMMAGVTLSITAYFEANAGEPCDVPTNVAILETGDESLSIGWDANADVAGWNVRYRQQGTTEWSYATTSTNSITLTNLTFMVWYEIQVQADCGDGNTSDWSATVLGYTLIPAVSEYLDSQVSLYPNPAREYVDIRVEGDLNVKMMEVYDVYGKLINTVMVTENPTRINVSSLANGMYFVRVSTEAGMVTKTFIKK